ncbi:MAG TPA: ATP-grasp domain-containing protein [Candidatus Methylomirabilis sp.]|nr:ATP-grasp domain-containing protein [Candidatus Methylomirabilis sp.]
MKIFVHECITGGGLPSSMIVPTLLAEGRMMLEALLSDLFRLEEHHMVLLIDRRRLKQVPLHPRLRVVHCGRSYRRILTEMVEQADAALLVAPETAGLLEGITAIVEARGRLVLGSSTVGIKAAGDKAVTYRLLKARGIPSPETHLVPHLGDALPLARHLGYPVVVKPVDGVGCQSVFVARGEPELQRAFATARRECGPAALLLQSYAEGVHASVSLVTDGVRSLPLTLNLQEIRGRPRLRYGGGRVPLDHPLRPLAFRRAGEVVEAIPGLKGYVGIDMVLTDRDAVVIEVNPRLTTSYVGIQKVLQQNLAALIIDAVRGKLPDRRQIRIAGTATFTTRSCEDSGRRSNRWFA